MNFRLSRLLATLFYLLQAAVAMAAGGTAAIEGQVRLAKMPAAMTHPVVSQRYQIISQSGVMSTLPPLAVVYLEGDFPPPAEAPRARMIQKELAFSPALLPVQVGTRVEFPNLDDTYHNVFSFSPAKRFDLGRYRPDERPVPSVLFEQPGMVTLRCEIHEHMRAIILVVPTPHFVLTDAAGRFRLEGLPAGKFKLKAWLDSRTTLETPVELQDGALVQLDLR